MRKTLGLSAALLALGATGGLPVLPEPREKKRDVQFSPEDLEWIRVQPDKQARKRAVLALKDKYFARRCGK